jgi:hypothetical protein
MNTADAIAGRGLEALRARHQPVTAVPARTGK